MRWLLSLAALVALHPIATVCADPADEPRSFEHKSYAVENGSITPTPEMWFYLQEQQRHDDPQMAVRRNAESRAAQRRSRLAAMKWFGLSKQRPRANPTPLFGVYSSAWVAGVWEPYRWICGGHPATLVLTDRVLSDAGR